MEDVVAEVEQSVEGGSVYVLQRRGETWDIVIDGQLAMSSLGPRLETSIVELALAPWGDRDDLTVLLAGLGMGLTLRALLAWPQIQKVDVVESSATILGWARGPLAPLNGHSLEDRRVRVLNREVGEYLREPQEPGGGRPNGWSIIILDTDEWPVALSRPENVDFYHEDGLLVLETALRPGGVFVTHTARRDDELDARLRGRLQSVARVGVPVDSGGQGGIQYVYRGRRSSVGGGES